MPSASAPTAPTKARASWARARKVFEQNWPEIRKDLLAKQARWRDSRRAKPLGENARQAACRVRQHRPELPVDQRQRHPARQHDGVRRERPERRGWLRLTGSPTCRGSASDSGCGSSTTRRFCRERPAVDWFEALSENYLVPGGKPLGYLMRIARALPGRDARRVAVDRQHRSAGPRVSAPAEGSSRRASSRTGSPIICAGPGWPGANSHDCCRCPTPKRALAHVVERVRTVQDILGPAAILLENVSSYVAFRDSTITEWEIPAPSRRRAPTADPARRQQHLRERGQPRVRSARLPRTPCPPSACSRSTSPGTRITATISSTPTTGRSEPRCGSCSASPGAHRRRLDLARMGRRYPGLRRTTPSC